MPGFDRHVRVAARAPPLARPGRMPSRERLGRDPDCEAAALLQRPVVRRPVADLVARPGDLVAARFIGLVVHRSSGERGSGPIRPTVALPKPRGAISHQRLAEDTAMLTLEALTVIQIRLTQLSCGGPAAGVEAQRMVSEKVSAFAEAAAPLATG